MPKMFQCPNCGADLVVLKSDMGKEVLCTVCNIWTEVPEETIETDKPLNCKIRKKSQELDTPLQEQETERQMEEQEEDDKKTSETIPDETASQIHQTEATASPQDTISVDYDRRNSKIIMTFKDFLKLATPRVYITFALIAINAVVFIAMVVGGVSMFEPQPEQIITWGAKVTELILINNEWWRLVSCVFIHIGLLHFAINMWALWNVGILAERLFGNIRFLVIYLLSGLGGSIFSLYFSPVAASAGASGAIFGIIGALIPCFISRDVRIPQPISRRILLNLLIIVGINLFIGFTIKGIDNAGHIGGLVTGLGAGYFLKRRLPPVKEPKRYIRYLGVAGIAFIFSTLLISYSPFFIKYDLPISYGNTGWVYYLKGDYESCIKLSKKAIKINPVTALYARYNIALCYLRLERIEDARSLYTELENGEIKLDKDNHYGAVTDLVELILNNILEDEARGILKDIFGLTDQEIDSWEIKSV
jgi:membrane associated rhomboid family serine protease/transcription elongation factor Elf1